MEINCTKDEARALFIAFEFLLEERNAEHELLETDLDMKVIRAALDSLGAAAFKESA